MTVAALTFVLIEIASSASSRQLSMDTFHNPRMEKAWADEFERGDPSRGKLTIYTSFCNDALIIILPGLANSCSWSISIVFNNIMASLIVSNVCTKVLK